MVFDQRYAWGRAYRDGSLVCGRVHVTFGRDDRLGLAPGERRHVIARFLDRLHPTGGSCNNEHAQRAALIRAVRVFDDRAFAGGCELRAVPDS